MKLPLVSVIITTKNEAKNIGRCLESIQAQTYKPIEIIVVDNKSTDDTKKIARKYTKNVFDLPICDKKRIKNFRGAQVNFGSTKSKGKIIFFPDADMTFDRVLIKNAVSLLERSDALYVPEIICGNGFFGKIRNFERSFYNETVIDGIRFVNRNIFFKNGGFDEENIVFGPDDWDVTKKLKCDNAVFNITKKSIYHHEEEMTFKKYINKKTKYVSTFDNYIKKWGEKDPDIHKQFSIGYRYFGVFIENRKWKKLLCHPILTLGMYYLRFLVGVRYLLSR